MSTSKQPREFSDMSKGSIGCGLLCAQCEDPQLVEYIDGIIIEI